MRNYFQPANCWVEQKNQTAPVSSIPLKMDRPLKKGKKVNSPSADPTSISFRIKINFIGVHGKNVIGSREACPREFP